MNFSRKVDTLMQSIPASSSTLFQCGSCNGSPSAGTQRHTGASAVSRHSCSSRFGERCGLAAYLLAPLHKEIVAHLVAQGCTGGGDAGLVQHVAQVEHLRRAAGFSAKALPVRAAAGSAPPCLPTGRAASAAAASGSRHLRQRGLSRQ